MHLTRTYQLMSQLGSLGALAAPGADATFNACCALVNVLAACNPGLVPPSRHTTVQQLVKPKPPTCVQLSTFLFFTPVLSQHGPALGAQAPFPKPFSRVHAPFTRSPLPTSIHFIATHGNPSTPLQPSPQNDLLLGRPFALRTHV